MSEPVWLLKPALMAVHTMLIARFGGTDGIRDEQMLESAMGRPRNLLAYDADTTLAQLAASYASGIIQNHPFVDGNKRTGFIAAFMFLDLNGVTLQADEAGATAMTLGLAASDVGEAAYAAWIAANLE